MKKLQVSLKVDVRRTSSCWMVLLLMVEEEVRRVWTMMLSLIGVAVEVYDSAVAYIATGGSWVRITCRQYSSRWKQMLEEGELLDGVVAGGGAYSIVTRSCVWWSVYVVSNGTVLYSCLVVIATTVKVPVRLPMISKLVGPHRL